jgi:hypothetical protein
LKLKRNFDKIKTNTEEASVALDGLQQAITTEATARALADTNETIARSDADNAIERDLGVFNTVQALSNKLGTMTTDADVGHYRFIVQGYNHSLEIYCSPRGYVIQVIRGTITLDEGGNLENIYSTRDFIQIERRISTDFLSNWKYSKTEMWIGEIDELPENRAGTKTLYFAY